MIKHIIQRFFLEDPAFAGHQFFYLLADDARNPGEFF